MLKVKTVAVVPLPGLTWRLERIESARAGAGANARAQASSTAPSPTWPRGARPPQRSPPSRELGVGHGVSQCVGLGQGGIIALLGVGETQAGGSMRSVNVLVGR